jgi:Protein of unknown function (DUF3224)
LIEVRLNETFAGDIDGGSPVRALQVLRDDKSACLVSMQRFRGGLNGQRADLRATRFRNRRQRQDQGNMTVVPGSGTGDLSGLRGEGGFEGDFGKGSEGTLDYWFE